MGLIGIIECSTRSNLHDLNLCGFDGWREGKVTSRYAYKAFLSGADARESSRAKQLEAVIVCKVLHSPNAQIVHKACEAYGIEVSSAQHKL